MEIFNFQFCRLVPFSDINNNGINDSQAQGCTDITACNYNTIHDDAYNAYEDCYGNCLNDAQIKYAMKFKKAAAPTKQHLTTALPL